MSKFAGEQRCEKDLRIAAGASGTAKMRVYAVDREDRSIPVSYLQKESTPPFTVKDNLRIRTGSVVVLDAETGKKVPNATATLTLQNESAGWLQPNPNYEAARQHANGKLVPHALSALIDMSEQSAHNDVRMSRSLPTTDWALKNANKDINAGPLDVLSVLLMRNNVLSSQDNLFLNVDTSKQTLGQSSIPRGFLKTSQENLDNYIVRSLLDLSNNKIGQHAPLYGSIAEAATNTNDISKGQAGEKTHNPAIIVMTLSEDAHVADPSAATDDFEKAKSALQGEDGEFVPLMSVVYSPQKGDVPSAWEARLDQLCELAKAGTADGTNYFGQVFRVYENLELPYTQERELPDVAKAQHLAAYHATKGWIGLDIQYQLSGVTTGKDYLVAFILDGTLNGQKTEVSQQSKESFQIFRVRP
ncbi:MAG: hypothetical protein H6727_01420 [Myxococcales bacterium]|nr:hypothetical protein [Myxococcales bacterium]